MATPSSSQSEKMFKFNTPSKVIAIVFGPDSTDCSFQFVADIATTQISEIKTHRKLLSALSPVFATMFAGSCNGFNQPIPIVDVSFDTFRTFLAYFYSGEITVNTKNINEMMYLAHKYTVEDVVASCSMFLMKQLSIENAIPNYCMAISYHQLDLITKCAEFITNNMENILKSETFIQCDQQTLKRILDLQPKNFKTHDVFDSCIEWGRYKCRNKGINELSPVNLRNELGDSFKSIRLKRMERDEFYKRIQLIGAMMTQHETDDVLKYFRVIEKWCQQLSAHTYNKKMSQSKN